MSPGPAIDGREPRRWSGRRAYILLALLTALSFAPLVSVVLAAMLASARGCTLNEGDPHPCIVLGADIGEVLYGMFVLGWFMLLTWPGMLLTLLCWLGLGIRALVMRARSQPPPLSRR